MPSAACAGRDGMDPAQSQARAALGGRAATPRSITPQTFLLQQHHPESLPSAGLISARPEIKENPPNGANLQPRGWARSWARGGGQHPQIQPLWVSPCLWHGVGCTKCPHLTWRPLPRGTWPWVPPEPPAALPRQDKCPHPPDSSGVAPPHAPSWKQRCRPAPLHAFLRD